METVPEIPKCFGIFPPKIATYFIALFGLASGGVGLAGLLLYALVEDSIVAVFYANTPIDGTVKKVVLMTFGMTTLLLLVSNGLLFIGIFFNQHRALHLGAYFIVILCAFLVIGAVSLPLMCFFLPDTCFIKKISGFEMTVCYMFVTIFLWIWLYFMAVVFNHLNEIEE